MDNELIYIRKKTRLTCWDYSTEGCYFVTFCTYRRAHLFGEVQIPTSLTEQATMNLNKFGSICRSAVEQLPTKMPTISIESFVVMPNHVHILIHVNAQDTVKYRSTVARAVGSIKATTTKQMKEQGFAGTVWQSGFHDHIVRDENDYQRIYRYIENNPAKWLFDKYNR